MFYFVANSSYSDHSNTSISCKKIGKGKRPGKGGNRFWKSIGLGFKTPREAIEGTYIDKKSPFTGTVSIRGRILAGTYHSAKMFFGLDSQQKVTSSYVVVIGLGGVGSHAASMLLRSGVAEKTAFLRPIELKLVPVPWKTFSSMIPKWLRKTKIVKQISQMLVNHLGLNLTKDDLQNVVDLMEPYGQISNGIEYLNPSLDVSN
ncbi:hypothetical protein ES332_D01G206600v1 [Gossypium tomentosum]|uniref:40S ribosomal protein S11 N-terminal domain-containing protein n=1 Tax=Gossypium tomentosum TaxID=34277 RepID=A0A5D2MBC2_GOSTO|nr:hypothetical protein ES332_D01G206600v1 [Gossypium tomentosum]